MQRSELREDLTMAIKGAVLGDILGAQYEFNRSKDLDWEHVALLSDQGVGFTDDSVMSLAIKKALVEGKDLVETMVSITKTMKKCRRWLRLQQWFPIIILKESKEQL